MRLFLAGVGAITVFAVNPRAVTGQELDIRQLMSPREFQAAGLEKLDADELDSLNAWLVTFAVEVLTLAEQQVPPASSPSEGVIESNIEGTFEGWDGETIFRLTNGQIWQQASYAYLYHYAYRPRVLIYRSGGGFKMKVDGVSSEIFVRRVR